MFKDPVSGLGKLYIAGSSRSWIHGELPCCSEGKTKRGSKHLKSNCRSTQMEEHTCSYELLLVSETSTTSLPIKFSVRIGSVVFNFCQHSRLICLATTVGKFILHIYCRRDVTLGSTLKRDDVLMQWPRFVLILKLRWKLRDHNYDDVRWDLFELLLRSPNLTVHLIFIIRLVFKYTSYSRI